MVYPALLPLIRVPRLPVDWTIAPADLNGLVRFVERRKFLRMCHHILDAVYHAGRRLHTSRDNALVLGNDSGGQHCIILPELRGWRQFELYYSFCVWNDPRWDCNEYESGGLVCTVSWCVLWVVVYCELVCTVSCAKLCCLLCFLLQGNDRSRVDGRVAGSALRVQMNWLATPGLTQEKRISPVLSAARNLCAVTISG
jgi:hypothetical protein